MHPSFLILQMRCNVEVDPPIRQSKFTSFDKHTIAQLHYTQDEHGNYVKKVGKEEQERHEVEDHDDEAQEQQIPAPLPHMAFDAQTAFQTMMSEMASLRTYMTERFDDIGRRFDHLETRLDGIEERNEQMFDEVQATRVSVDA